MREGSVSLEDCREHLSASEFDIVSRMSELRRASLYDYRRYHELIKKVQEAKAKAVDNQTLQG